MIPHPCSTTYVRSIVPTYAVVVVQGPSRLNSSNESLITPEARERETLIVVVMVEGLICLMFSLSLSLFGPVRYVADEFGYRVIGTESSPVGDGPKEDREGSAIVQQVVSGVQTQYAIR